jgi:ribonuclease HI
MSGDDDLAAVIQRERQLLREGVLSTGGNLDPAEVERLLHPGFVEFGAAGHVWDRASILELIVGQPPPRGSASGFTPVRLTADVVLLTYRFAGAAGSSLRSSLWLRDDHVGWHLRFHQGTPTPV